MQDSFDPDSAASWRMRLYRKSLTQQAQLRHLRRFLSPTEGKRCLVVGGGEGMIPYLLRQEGGDWVGAEIDDAAAGFLRVWFGEDRVFRLEGAELPFDDDAFEVIVVNGALVRIRDDALFLKECHRCLQAGGELLVHVPRIKSFSVNRGLRNVLGLTGERLGRVRPGYRPRDLYEISKDGYDIVESETYGGFFVQFFDAWLRYFTGEAGEHPALPVESRGEPLTQPQLRAYAKTKRLYSLWYPLMKLAAGLDRLFSFTCTHFLVIKARPRPWQQRKSVRMRDGRSIADAAINTRIGSAADLTDPKNNRGSSS